jgi:hypothetical protein
MFNNFLFGKNVKNKFVQIWIFKKSGTASAQNGKGVMHAMRLLQTKQEKIN